MGRKFLQEIRDGLRVPPKVLGRVGVPPGGLRQFEGPSGKSNMGRDPYWRSGTGR